MEVMACTISHVSWEAERRFTEYRKSWEASTSTIFLSHGIRPTPRIRQGVEELEIKEFSTKAW
jgi:hypothetical protein